MDNKYFIYCIFKQKHQGWKGSVSGSTPPPPRKSAGFCCVSPLFPLYASPHQQPLAFLLILPPLDLSAVLCSGCNCIWATSAQRTHAGVSLARSKVKGSSREAQWGHSGDFSVWKTGPSLWVQTSPRLCSGPFKNKYEPCDYLFVNYIFIYPFTSARLDMVRLIYFRGPSLWRVGFVSLFACTALLSSGFVIRILLQNCSNSSKKTGYEKAGL